MDSARVPHGPDLPPAVCMRDDEDFAFSAPDQGQADALVSNFGVEYVDRRMMAPACARWLRPGARLHVALHAAGSIINRVSLASAQDIVWALDDVGLFSAAHALFEAMAAIPSDPVARAAHGREARDGYNRAIDQLKQRMEFRGEASAPLMDMLQSLRALAGLPGQGALAQAQHALALRVQALRAEVNRLQEMQASALDAPQRQALEQALGAAGFDDLRFVPIECEVGLVGWSLSARRR
jgi:hypothetical protein